MFIVSGFRSANKISIALVECAQNAGIHEAAMIAFVVTIADCSFHISDVWFSRLSRLPTTVWQGT